LRIIASPTLAPSRSCNKVLIGTAVISRGSAGEWRHLIYHPAGSFRIQPIIPKRHLGEASRSTVGPFRNGATDHPDLVGYCQPRKIQSPPRRRLHSAFQRSDALKAAAGVDIAVHFASFHADRRGRWPGPPIARLSIDFWPGGQSGELREAPDDPPF